jgi:hypothetical protein
MTLALRNHIIDIRMTHVGIGATGTKPRRCEEHFRLVGGDGEEHRRRCAAHSLEP